MAFGRQLSAAAGEDIAKLKVADTKPLSAETQAEKEMGESSMSLLMVLTFFFVMEQSAAETAEI
jgi:hypothetical protein